MDDPRIGLMPGQVERLVMLAEEAGKIVHAVHKVLRHGYENYHPHDPDRVTNRATLVQEIRDLVAVASAMGSKGDIPLLDEDGFYSSSASEVWRRKLSHTRYQEQIKSPSSD